MDTLDGRRKKATGPPKKSALREEVMAMREGNIPASALGEVLARSYRSVAAQKRALRGLQQKYGGTHAPSIAGFGGKK